MAAGHAGSDLGRWHHGRSNALECMGDVRIGARPCRFEDTNLDDRAALHRARKHARATGHSVERSRTEFQIVSPPKSDGE